MRVLLTNDDGLSAPGIVALYDALTDARGEFGGPLGELVVPIAPLTVQSATSHGVTFHQPLMVTERRVTERMTGVAVDGRPADCVKLALSAIWPTRFGAGSRPDLVISGMNAGANVGVNLIYSGTVAAAIEAAFLGVPSIAVSLHIGGGKTDFARAAARSRRALDRVLADGLPDRHACINVNIPMTEADGAGGQPPLVVCPMNTHGLNDRYERRLSPSGDEYFWAAGGGLDFHTTDADSDVAHLMLGRITVTPLWYDLTNHAALDVWRKRLGG